MVKVLAIIPTYNESENVDELLFRLDKVRDRLNDRYSIDILIVDDSSPDKTADSSKFFKNSESNSSDKKQKIWSRTCIFGRI
jgi:glycosyltransferase involved in cell wall biosynthesis